jgi:hypothetical protein
VAGPAGRQLFCFIQTANWQRENRHVMCVVEKAGFEPRTLRTGAGRHIRFARTQVRLYRRSPSEVLSGGCAAGRDIRVGKSESGNPSQEI